MTVRQARDVYFRRNGLSEQVYAGRWKARARALVLHDLHHVATGCSTTWRGEAELGAWELGGGCGRHWPAWLFKLGAFALGLAIAPRTTVRAFRCGRRCRNLFRTGYSDALLDLPLAELRARIGLPDYGMSLPVRGMIRRRSKR